MALKRVNAAIVGAGAGGGVVAKELAAAGLTVALLERGKWHSAADCRKDDLFNQRTQALGAKFGPDDERNPRVLVDEQGRETIVTPSDGGYSNNAACVGGGTFSYGAMAGRFRSDDERNPRVLVDEQGRETIVTPSDGGYSNNAACVGGGTFSYGAMAWRY